MDAVHRKRPGGSGRGLLTGDEQKRREYRSRRLCRNLFTTGQLHRGSSRTQPDLRFLTRSRFLGSLRSARGPIARGSVITRTGRHGSYVFPTRCREDEDRRYSIQFRRSFRFGRQSNGAGVVKRLLNRNNLLSAPQGVSSVQHGATK